MTGNYITNIAIVGAGGRVGQHITQHLLKTNKHKITALTRPDSTNKLPDGVQVKKIDYNDKSNLVSALQGQDALIITLSVMAPPSQQEALIDAAAEAGVQWIIPNEYSPDQDEGTLMQDTFLADKAKATRKKLESVGIPWTSITSSFWYEYSLSQGPLLFGFDFDKKSVTFYDEGTVKIPATTFPQTGRTLAALMSLPIKAEGGNKVALENWRNKPCYVQSFNISQRDIFESVLRVTGDDAGDWKVGYEDVKERYAAGVQEMKSGNRMGFAKLLYARVFYPDGQSNHAANGKLDNEKLGLPVEDLDEATKVAVELAKEPKAW